MQSQSARDSEPSSDVSPSPQVSHAVAAVAFENLPGVHLVHFSGLEAPLSGKNFPLTHSSQLEDDEAPVTAEYLPAWQSVHIEDDA